MRSDELRVGSKVRVTCQGNIRCGCVGYVFCTHSSTGVEYVWAYDPDTAPNSKAKIIRGLHSDFKVLGHIGDLVTLLEIMTEDQGVETLHIRRLTNYMVRKGIGKVIGLRSGGVGVGSGGDEGEEEYE